MVQSRTITGQITTDAQGKDTTSVPPAGGVPSISYSGYAPEGVPVGNEFVVNARLLQEPGAMNEVVVGGYYSTREKAVKRHSCRGQTKGKPVPLILI